MGNHSIHQHICHLNARHANLTSTSMNSVQRSSSLKRGATTPRPPNQTQENHLCSPERHVRVLYTRREEGLSSFFPLPPKKVHILASFPSLFPLPTEKCNRKEKARKAEWVSNERISNIGDDAVNSKKKRRRNEKKQMQVFGRFDRG